LENFFLLIVSRWRGLVARVNPFDKKIRHGLQARASGNNPGTDLALFYKITTSQS
jgi:hypothetical protein